MTKKLFVWTALVALALLAMPALAEEVDEIIAKNIETRGGESALKGVKSARMSGTMDMGGGMKVPVTMSFKRPNKVRLEMEMQGMKIIQAYDGATGWQIMPMMGSTEPEKLAGDQLKQVKRMADFDGPLVDYSDKGHTVELVGKEDVDGTEAYKVKLTLEDGDVIYNYMDTEYFLVFKQEGKVNFQGQDTNVDVSLGDYKEVGRSEDDENKVLIAHSTTQTFEGAPVGMVIEITEVKLDVDVEDSEFDFPEKQDGGAEEKEG